MDFLSSKKELSRTESAHIIIFFSFETTPQPVTRTEKRNTNEKKNGSFYICCALVVAKEKRDERDARKSSSSYSSPFTVLARCHASFRHGFFERVSERNFKSSRVSNVSVRFICLCLLPRFWFYAHHRVHAMCSFFAHSLSLSL